MFILLERLKAFLRSEGLGHDPADKGGEDMINQTSSILGLPETTNGARSTLGPRAVHSEWDRTFWLPYTVLLEVTRGRAGQTFRLSFPRGPRASGAPGQVVGLAPRLAHCSRPPPSQLGTRPTPFTGLTSRPFLPSCYSRPHRKTHHGAKHR